MRIYTDGGCSGNPGPGGWAYVISDPDHGNSVIMENSGAEDYTTNNRMELMAVISALEYVNGSGVNGEIEVFTDSQYVQKGITIWIKNWKKRNWKTSGNDPVKNLDLWQRLDDLVQGLPVKWHWIKGHAGNVNNERCDDLVQQAIASLR
ncbi:MAG: ribonuclease HI [Treponema sp.]|nr:ribonuclease HI [Treponema sp.]